MELRSRNSVHAFALVFILGFTSTTTVADNATEPAESPKEDSKSEKTQGRNEKKVTLFPYFPISHNFKASKEVKGSTTLISISLWNFHVLLLPIIHRQIIVNSAGFSLYLSLSCHEAQTA